MAEVLIGTEWVEVEESLEQVEARLGSFDDPVPTPIFNRMLLTTPSRARTDAHGREIPESRKTMKVAIAAINAIREPIAEDR
jgi:hypothetical protein